MFSVSKKMKLTSKQEQFATLLASGVNQSEAYRQAYNASKMKDNTIWRKAHAEAQHPKILARVAELRKPVIDKAEYTIETHIQDLLAASQAASEAGQYSAAVRAIELMGKVSGFYSLKIDASVRPAEAKGLSPHARALCERLGIEL